MGAKKLLLQVPPVGMKGGFFQVLSAVGATDTTGSFSSRKKGLEFCPSFSNIHIPANLSGVSINGNDSIFKRLSHFPVYRSFSKNS